MVLCSCVNIFGSEAEILASAALVLSKLSIFLLFVWSYDLNLYKFKSFIILKTV